MCSFAGKLSMTRKQYRMNATSKCYICLYTYLNASFSSIKKKVLASLCLTDQVLNSYNFEDCFFHTQNFLCNVILTFNYRLSNCTETSHYLPVFDSLRFPFRYGNTTFFYTIGIHLLMVSRKITIVLFDRYQYTVKMRVLVNVP